MEKDYGTCRIIKIRLFRSVEKYFFQMSNLSGKEEISLMDIGENFVDHPAQWKLNKRGVRTHKLL